MARKPQINLGLQAEKDSSLLGDHGCRAGDCAVCADGHQCDLNMTRKPNRITFATTEVESFRNAIRVLGELALA